MKHPVAPLIFAAALAATPALAGDVTVKPVLAQKLPNVPGKSVTLLRVTIPPGGTPAAHHHAGAVAVYVLSGSIKSQLRGGPLQTFKAGDTFFEPPGAEHAVSDNASKTEPAELLAVFVADDGATLTTNNK